MFAKLENFLYLCCRFYSVAVKWNANQVIKQIEKINN